MLFWMLLVSALSPRNSAISDRQPLQTTSWLEPHRSMACMIASAPARSNKGVNGTARHCTHGRGVAGSFLESLPNSPHSSQTSIRSKVLYWPDGGPNLSNIARGEKKWDPQLLYIIPYEYKEWGPQLHLVIECILGHQ